jgi:hypothetical protein
MERSRTANPASGQDLQLFDEIAANHGSGLAQLLLRSIQAPDVPAAVNTILRSAVTAIELGSDQPHFRLILDSYTAFLNVYRLPLEPAAAPLRKPPIVAMTGMARAHKAS